MDRNIEILLSNANSGTNLGIIDWELEMQACIEAGDLNTAIHFAQKANTALRREELEDLLLNAICLGKTPDAIKTLQVLNRNFTKDEYALIYESTILNGNVEGICALTTAGELIHKASIHTCLTISAIRYVRKFEGKATSSNISLTSWNNLYIAEVKRLNLRLQKVLVSSNISACFILLSNDSLQRVLGVLLAHGGITEEQVAYVLS